MHSVPFAALAYKFILMLFECIYFEVKKIMRFWTLETRFAER